VAHHRERGGPVSRPNLDLLIACVAEMARSMGLPAARDDDARAFLETLLFAPQDAGGKDTWAAITLGIITEVEGRNLLMAHCASWLAAQKGRAEPSSDRYVTAELEAGFERALYGRRAT
jgi:hypothetical protein